MADLDDEDGRWRGGLRDAITIGQVVTPLALPCGHFVEAAAFLARSGTLGACCPLGCPDAIQSDDVEITFSYTLMRLSAALRAHDRLTGRWQDPPMVWPEGLPGLVGAAERGDLAVLRPWVTMGPTRFPPTACLTLVTQVAACHGQRACLDLLGDHFASQPVDALAAETAAKANQPQTLRGALERMTADPLRPSLLVPLTQAALISRSEVPARQLARVFFRAP